MLGPARPHPTDGGDVPWCPCGTRRCRDRPPPPPPGTAERHRAPSGSSLHCWVIEAHRCNADVPTSSARDSGNYVTKSTFQVYIFQLKFWRRSAVAMGPPGAVPGRFWVRGERGAGDVRLGPGRGVSMPRASGGEAKAATGVKRAGRMKRAGALNN